MTLAKRLRTTRQIIRFANSGHELAQKITLGDVQRAEELIVIKNPPEMRAKILELTNQLTEAKKEKKKRLEE